MAVPVQELQRGRPGRVPGDLRHPHARGQIPGRRHRQGKTHPVACLGRAGPQRRRHHSDRDGAGVPQCRPGRSGGIPADDRLVREDPEQGDPRRHPHQPGRRQDQHQCLGQRPQRGAPGTARFGRPAGGQDPEPRSALPDRRAQRPGRQLAALPALQVPHPGAGGPGRVRNGAAFAGRHGLSNSAAVGPGATGDSRAGRRRGSPHAAWSGSS
ncbi:hypothetical protein D9M70_504150 [compost metagenome]